MIPLVIRALPRFRQKHQQRKELNIVRRKRILLMIFCGLSVPLFPQSALAEESDKPSVEKLWPDGAPGGGEPKITVFLAPKKTANGTAVIVCPGGSYKGLAEYEGNPVAEWLNTLGVTGIVLE